MPSAPDRELEVVRTTRNLMFHGSKKELVSLVLSTLMCVEVVMEQMRCCSKHDKVTMQGKAKSVGDMRERLNKIITGKLDGALTKMGAVLALGLMSAGGQNCTMGILGRVTLQRLAISSVE
jgi:hypothetical protein